MARRRIDVRVVFWAHRPVAPPTSWLGFTRLWDKVCLLSGQRARKGGEKGRRSRVSSSPETESSTVLLAERVGLGGRQLAENVWCSSTFCHTSIGVSCAGEFWIGGFGGPVMNKKRFWSNQLTVADTRH